MLETRPPEGTGCVPPRKEVTGTPPSLRSRGSLEAPGTQRSRCTDSTYRPGLSALSTVLPWAGQSGGDPRAFHRHSRRVQRDPEGVGRQPVGLLPSRNWAKGVGAEVSASNTRTDRVLSTALLPGVSVPGTFAARAPKTRSREGGRGLHGARSAHLGGVPGVAGRRSPAIPTEEAVEDVDEQRVEGVHGSAGRQRAPLRAAPRPRARTPRPRAAKPVRMLEAAAPTALLPRVEDARARKEMPETGVPGAAPGHLPRASHSCFTETPG